MRVSIIGAGITGLSAAYFLARQGHEVSVFDSAPQVGGLAGFFNMNGAYLEKYYHHCFAGHTELIELMGELGIQEDLFFSAVKTGFFYEDRIYPFATAQDLLCFDALKLRDRARLGLTSLAMMHLKDWRSLEKSSALQWLERYSGQEACRIIWRPLLSMKFGDHCDRVSAAWLWNRVVDRRRSGGGKDILGYPRGGYKILFDALTRQIESHGGYIETEAPVERINVASGRAVGVSSNGRFLGGDAVLATVPIPSFLQMAPFLPKEYANGLRSIQYQMSVCVVLTLREALSDYYWINVSDPDSPFVGVIEHTNLVSPEHYANRRVVYLSRYSSSEDGMLSESDERIYRAFVAYLSGIFPGIRERDVEQYRVFRDRFSQPVFVKNFSRVMPGIVTPIKDLYLLNTTQLYPQSRTINSSVAKARHVAGEVIGRGRA